MVGFNISDDDVVTADGCIVQILRWKLLAPYLFVIVMDYVLRASIPGDCVRFMIRKCLS